MGPAGVRYSVECVQQKHTESRGEDLAYITPLIVRGAEFLELILTT